MFTLSKASAHVWYFESLGLQQSMIALDNGVVSPFDNCLTRNKLKCNHQHLRIWHLGDNLLSLASYAIY